MQRKKKLNIFTKAKLSMTKTNNYSLSFIPIYSSYTALDNFSYTDIFSYTNTLIIQNKVSNEKVNNPVENYLIENNPLFFTQPVKFQ